MLTLQLDEFKKNITLTTSLSRTNLSDQNYSSTIAEKCELGKITHLLPYLVHRIYKRIYFIGSCSDLIAEMVLIEAR